MEALHEEMSFELRTNRRGDRCAKQWGGGEFQSLEVTSENRVHQLMSSYGNGSGGFEFEYIWAI